MHLRYCTVVVAALALFVQHAYADLSLDLTTAGSSGTVNGAIYQQVPDQSTGTGVIDSFVRIQHNGSEQGYNTDGSPFEFDEKGGAFTHSITLGEVPILNILGTDYRVFLLDINQVNSNDNHLLSLDSIKLFQNSAPDITHLSDLGSALYDLDGGGAATIELDYSLNPGSGAGDMYAYIPDSLFTQNDDSYVYLYSAFGQPHATNDGFEEWAILKVDGDTRVPTPGAALLGLIGLCFVGRFKRATA